MRRILAVAALATTLITSGCYRRTSGTGSQPATVVRVDNQSFYDYNIYVVPEAGGQVRLGLAPAKSQHDFTIPASLLTGFARSMRFLARPLASQGGPVSEDVLVSPGDVIGLMIPPG
jgi:hypothetical protein